MYDVMCAKRET